MAGMCSAHKGYVAGCPQCQSDPPCNGKCVFGTSGDMAVLLVPDPDCPLHGETEGRLLFPPLIEAETEDERCPDCGGRAGSTRGCEACEFWEHEGRHGQGGDVTGSVAAVAPASPLPTMTNPECGLCPVSHETGDTYELKNCGVHGEAADQLHALEAENVALRIKAALTDRAAFLLGAQGHVDEQWWSSYRAMLEEK
jgi:hypothetical protein